MCRNLISFLTCQPDRRVVLALLGSGVHNGQLSTVNVWRQFPKGKSLRLHTSFEISLSSCSCSDQLSLDTRPEQQRWPTVLQDSRPRGVPGLLQPPSQWRRVSYLKILILVYHPFSTNGGQVIFKSINLPHE